MKILSLITLLSIALSVNAQSFCDKINFKNKKIDNCTQFLRADVALFNEIVEHFDVGVVIDVVCAENTVKYSFQGVAIENWNMEKEFSGDQLQLQHLGENKLRAFIPKGQSATSQHDLYISYNGAYLDIYNYENARPSGSFRRIDCDKNTLMRGNYETVDTLYSVVKTVFDPNTYQEMDLETTFEYHTHKSGTWTYFDESGNILLEEQYPGGSSSDYYQKYLCIDTKKESRKMSKILRYPFMVFNALCQQLELDYWISVDKLLNDSDYYINGKSVATPKPQPIRNTTESISISDDQLIIDISSTSNDYAALGKLEDKLKVSYNAVIKNGIDLTHLTFNNKHIEKYSTINNQRIGEYLKKTCDGITLSKGQYCLVDTMYSDTIVSFNAETYEEVVQITDYKNKSEKCGIWVDYNESGILQKEEDFGEF